ncbi:uncharacterized protein LOC129319218 [Prosopis cineraria]|uniref:uncharacterized protein LOC129319218 n=1 Tax=Prosopis cineraria TaxID=364024 RepID=UPI0024102605|nr:uncharacterized protein LOC129319218 [Prosopis cineraria]
MLHLQASYFTHSQALHLAIAMATPASSSILQPEQQQQQAGTGEAQIPTMTTAEAVPSPSAWKSSGSVGPFLAVISVLTVLAVLSCYLGRKWNPRPLTPLESIENRGCFGWLKLLRRRCIPALVPVGNVNKSSEILPSAKHNTNEDCKLEDGSEVAEQNLHRQV